jgi:hypothetical protein
MRPRMDGPIIPFAKEFLEIDATSGGVALTASVYRTTGGFAQMAYITVENAQIRYLTDAGDPIFSLFPGAALAMGTTDTAVATGAFFFDVAGVLYTKAAVADGTAPGNDVIPDGKYGAVALDIGVNGTIDVIEASGNEAGTYTTAALAVAGLAAVGASHIRLGYVTAMKTGAAFTFGTTALNAGTAVAFHSTATSTPGHIKEPGVDFWLESLDQIMGFRANRTTGTSALISVEYFK